MMQIDLARDLPRRSAQVAYGLHRLQPMQSVGNLRSRRFPTKGRLLLQSQLLLPGRLLEDWLL
jgi:hypothetical protein